MTDNIIEVRDLCKSYGNIRAVKNASFSVEQGKKFAFLGPNGAGKSTTISILCTLSIPDSGNISIDGMDISDPNIRKKIGIVFQDSLLDNDLTVRENLIFAADLYGIPKNKIPLKLEWISGIMDLSDIIDRRYGILSGGQRRRTDIARALINDPKILFLDEPSTGLDPQNRRMIWNIINDLNKKENITIFMTTHYMEEAAGMDQVVVIDHGMIVAQGTPDQLREKYTSDRIRMIPKNIDSLIAKLSTGNISYSMDGNTVVVNIADTLSSLKIINDLRDELEGFEVFMGTMDDAFINIIKEEKT